MKKYSVLNKTSWALTAIVTLVAFNNCGEGFVVTQMSGINTSGSFLFSRAPGETCEDALVKVYKNTYHPFLSQNCNSCHVSGGGGNGVFAESDVAASYTSFSAKGASVVNSQSVGNHRPPYTGARNQARIDEISAFWADAQVEYAACVSQSPTSGGPSTGGLNVVKTTDRPVAANLGTTFVRLEWDLETQSAAKLPLVAGIDIRRAVVSNQTVGYEFRNPTLRLKNENAGPYAMRALNIYVNNQLQSDLTTYSNLETVIRTTTNFNFAPGFANALTVRTPNPGDMIALEFSSLSLSTNSPNPGATPSPTPPAVGTPTPTPTPSGNVNYASLVAAGGIFTSSCVACHSAANALGGLDLTNYTAAKNAAQNIKARINNANNPMPTGGLLPQAQRDRISAWVDQGAPL